MTHPDHNAEQAKALMLIDKLLAERQRISLHLEKIAAQMDLLYLTRQSPQRAARPLPSQGGKTIVQTSTNARRV